MSEQEPGLGLAVWMFAPPVSAAEWDAHLQAIREVAQWTHLGHRPLVIIEAFDWSPTAVHRREIAEASEHQDYRPALAIVTRNPMIRGALTAISWLQRQRAYVTGFFPSGEVALTWLQRQRGGPVPELHAMYARVRAQIPQANDTAD